MSYEVMSQESQLMVESRAKKHKDHKENGIDRTLRHLPKSQREDSSQGPGRRHAVKAMSMLPVLQLPSENKTLRPEGLELLDC